jgi:hypothetical protein
MTAKTLARLFNIAASRLLGEDGISACFYLGRAMACHALMDQKAMFGDAYYFDMWRNVNTAKAIFRQARRMRNIINLPPVRSSGGCRSTECEAAYLMTE